ncbi:FKBP-type peptidyl-prolyl cis-trans isomerase [Parabacteroides sp. PF5-9]|uniref:FKBP-type peptidyl-prolyl cis-trans isomerase n=1 Tax=Parabacteroides sp. PF5-9 TaxID=1742404 RepID=UPI0024735A10|nr:FKBP-type peptidyl-prolyl cis-trans isomerase [Parabacteroides sp. PF5-9]MDH6356166.1 FKBP-type peptidyl-prolyl cis-trans isomerase [Parabacteroides sp. PF5-9]
MMKKYWHIVLMLMCAFVIVSCDDDDEVVVDEVWKQQNEAAFAKIAADPAYTEIKSIGNNGSVYYKVLQEGTGTERILYNSTIKTYYTGKYVDGEIFDQRERDYQEPAVFSVNGMVEGATTALQYMKEGDRWEIWIPYQLGYGLYDNYDSYGNFTFRGACTLHFEFEILEIVDSSVTIQPK